MGDTSLDTPVQYLPGVGPRRAELLGKLGLLTVQDLLFTVPREILDLTHISAPDDVTEEELHTVRGRVIDRDARSLSQGRNLTAILIDVDGEPMRGSWFNQPWMLQKFQLQDLVLFSGKPKRKQGRWEFAHPQVQWLTEEGADAHGGVLPRYSLTEGLAMHEMRRIAQTVARDFAQLVADPLPAAFRDSLRLPSLSDAVRWLHVPETPEQFEAGRGRLIFQDLLEFQIAVSLRRRAWKKTARSVRLPTSAKIDSRIRRLFPFQLTAGQEQAIREITADLDREQAMHRLLQADVGAGKTLVAIYAMLVCVAAGYQAVLMSPTELLAMQHLATLDRLLAHSRVNRALLSGQLTGSERTATLKGIADGSLQLIVGTQAVIQDTVQFKQLGLVVIDEQHKFGVRQRSRFAAGGTTPHTLVMTATPIPRSLCLTAFGDLDLTVMTDLPPGRQRVVTSRVPAGPSREKAWSFVRSKLESGRQAYVVCPRIGLAEEKQDGRSVLSVAKDLAAGELKGYRLGLLHGQLPVEERNRTMDLFRRRELDLLVSTTMIEVGVDIPNATLMIVQNAESFGLAQLHQLRGRVGRGEFQGYCLLFSESEDPEAHARLHALQTKTRGFEIAEADFLLRGPGDMLGTRQHGELPLRWAQLPRDEAVLSDARVAAFELVQTGQIDQPEFAPLKLSVLDRFGVLFEISGSG